jgi:cell fate regulator YaaT (PSP1 superfamily)
MNLLFEIELDTGAKYEAYADESLGLKKNDFCLIRKDKYLDYGKISKFIGNLSTELNNSEIPKIDRKATMLDKSKANENQMRAKSAYRTAVTQIEKLKLQMKLLNVHFTYDRKLVTFLFTAEGRIDFRQLVKELSQILNTRIELRQIGVRDETAVLGGLGTCGQTLCCCRFLKKFESINVKMAKEQDLSLNPTNISGMCGRLKCCLKYEHEDYIELDKGMPRRGSSCECAEGVGKIVDRNLLTQKVTVYLNESAKYLTCPKEEIRVIYPNKYKDISSSKQETTKKKNEEVKDTKKTEHCKKNRKN